MLPKIIFLTSLVLLLISCDAYDENGCSIYKADCLRDYKISGTYNFSPAKDTFQIGESIEWEMDVPYEVWDTSTGKYISLKDFELFPIFIFREINFDTKEFTIPSYSVVYLEEIIEMQNLDTSNFQGTSVGNRLYFNLVEKEDGRKGKLKFHFNRSGTYIVGGDFNDPENNDDYLYNKIKFDTLDDLCCRQKIDPKFMYIGEKGGYHKWFQKDSIFTVIDFGDGSRYERNMLDPWVSKDMKLIVHVVE